MDKIIPLGTLYPRLGYSRGKERNIFTQLFSIYDKKKLPNGWLFSLPPSQQSRKKKAPAIRSKDCGNKRQASHFYLYDQKLAKKRNIDMGNKADSTSP